METYQPKGGMCMTCTHRAADCSHLAFDRMPVIQVWHNVMIVRCTHHVKAPS